MKTLIKVTSSGLGTNLILNDTVRPELDYDFRTSNGREFYELTDVLCTGACICVAYTRHVPKTVNELNVFYTEDNDIAVFYTVWSYTKGSGREIVFKVVEQNLISKDLSRSALRQKWPESFIYQMAQLF